MAEDTVLITMLEIRRLQRARIEDVRRRMAEEQLGEAWAGLSPVCGDPYDPNAVSQHRRTA